VTETEGGRLLGKVSPAIAKPYQNLELKNITDVQSPLRGGGEGSKKEEGEAR